MIGDWDNSPENSDRGRMRCISYGILAAAFGVVWLATRDADSAEYELVHTLLESVVSVLAFVVSAMAFTRYYSRREAKFLWLATGFFGAGILDVYHAALTSWVTTVYLPQLLDSTTEWSGIPARVFLAAMLCLSITSGTERHVTRQSSDINEFRIFAVAGGLFVLCLVVFGYLPLPSLYQPGSLVDRPANLIIGLIFGVALFGHLKKGEWRQHGRHFDHWLMMALIASMIGEAGFMAFSDHFLDLRFDVAHFAKIISFIFILTGLLISMRLAYRDAERTDQRFRSALATLEDGFALYDENDRLVIFNEPFVRLHPGSRDLIQVGMKFEDLVRNNFRKGIIANSAGREEELFQERVAEHRDPQEPIVRELNDGTWYIITESKTPEGWTAVVQTEITKLKQVETELEEKSQFLEATFNAMDDGLSVWSSDNRLLAFNKKFEMLMGQEGDRPYAGISILELFILNARAGLYGEGEPVALGTERYEGAMRTTDTANQFITFDPHGTYEVIRNRMPDGSRVTIHRNVTDRVAAEQRLSVVVENLSEFFVLWDPQDRMVISNRRFREINAVFEDVLVPGLPFETHVRTGVEHGLFPQAEADPEAWIAQRIADHRNPGAVREVQRQDNQWIMVHEQRLPDGSTVTIGTDITEIKQVEAQVIEREQRLSAILENIVDGIITFDHQGNMLSANSAAAKIFRCNAEEFTGRQIIELLADTGHDAFTSGRIANLELGEIGEIQELDGCRWDGQTFPMELAVTKVEIEEGAFFVCIVRDISLRREMERMKAEFVSTVSHELRTPLTSIRGSLGLIVAGAVGEIPDQAAELVEIAERNAHRLIGLVNDILDMEKIESGRMDYHFAEHSLAELAQNALVDNQGYADEHEVSFALIDHSEGAKASLDRERFAQVMANLLSNAAKFSPREGVVEVLLEVQETTVRVSVTDTGSGIPEEFHDRVFEKFTKADSSDTRKVGGTGLGLSITRSIVERHGGTVDFVSEVGKGTTFFFDLPVSSLEDARRPASGATAKVVGDNLGSRPSVLVCEDDHDVARLIAILLDKSGYDSEIAYTAGEAETLALTGRFDAVTVDLMLPDEHGLTLVRRIRNHPELVDLPIVIVSAIAETTKGTVEACGIEVIDWLSKPIEEDQLLEAIHGAVRRVSVGTAKILHVEDDLDLNRILRSLLPKDIEVTSALNLQDAREALTNDQFDLIVLDVILPDGSGLDLLPILHSEKHANTPTLLFSGQDVDRQVSHQVAGALVKSRTSNSELLTMINSLIERRAIDGQIERDKQL